MSKEKIIVALDVPTAEAARKIVGNLRGEVGAFKIGLQLFTAAGAPFVREIVEAGNKVFLDLKFHDIPNTVAKASIEAARLGVWMFNIHALGGSEMMRRAREETLEVCAKENLPQPEIIAVTVLTSSTEETLREIGIKEQIEEQVIKLARLASKCGLNGVVASPRETPLIRGEIEDKDFLIVTPGVRPQINVLSTDDQKRTTDPARAIEMGADYLVVGRPVLQAENPVEAVRTMISQIETTVKNALSPKG